MIRVNEGDKTIEIEWNVKSWKELKEKCQFDRKIRIQTEGFDNKSIEKEFKEKKWRGGSFESSTVQVIHFMELPFLEIKLLTNRYLFYNSYVFSYFAFLITFLVYLFI